MNTSQEIAQLATALSKAQGEMTGAKKGTVNPFFKSKYSDLASVMEAIADPFAKHGLSFVQSPGFDGQNVTVTTRIMHESGEWIEGTVVLPPTKNDAQGYGSSISYGKRYGLQAMTGCPSIDDDANAAVEHKATRINRVKAQEYIKSIESMLEAEDGLGLRQLNDELKLDETLLNHVWQYFTTDQKTKAKGLLHGSRDSAE